MLIHFNPLHVLNLLRLVQNANHEIADAQTLLNQVTSHNDWECSERNVINENTNNLKSRMNRLADNTSRYSTAVTNSITHFNQLEQLIPKKFSALDAIVGQIRRIAVSRAQPILEGVRTIASKIAESNGGVSKIVWGSIASQGLNVWRMSTAAEAASKITQRVISSVPAAKAAVNLFEGTVTAVREFTRDF